MMEGFTQVAASTDDAGYGGSFPVRTTAGTAVVWAVERGSPTGYLAAYDAVNMGDPMFKAEAGSRSYLSRPVANGRVYVPAYKTVTVFGQAD